MDQLRRLVPGGARFVADAAAVVVAAIAAVPVVIGAALWLTGILEPWAFPIAGALFVVWALTVVFAIYSVRRAVQYQRDRAREMADGLRVESVILSAFFENRDPVDVEGLCRATMTSAAQGLVRACLKGLKLEQKKVCFIHLPRSGPATGWALAGFSNPQESEVRMSKLTRDNGSAGKALRDGRIKVIPEVRQPPPDSGYFPLSDPPEHNGLMCAPVEGLTTLGDRTGKQRPTMGMTGTGALCIAWSGKTSVGDFDRLVLQEFARKMGNVCSTARAVYCRENRVCPLFNM